MAKVVSSTAQKRGQDMFLNQTCKRTEENLLMDKFSNAQERIDDYEGEGMNSSTVEKQCETGHLWIKSPGKNHIMQ